MHNEENLEAIGAKKIYEKNYKDYNFFVVYYEEKET